MKNITIYYIHNGRKFYFTGVQGVWSTLRSEAQVCYDSQFEPISSQCEFRHLYDIRSEQA